MSAPTVVEAPPERARVAPASPPPSSGSQPVAAAPAAGVAAAPTTNRAAAAAPRRAARWRRWLAQLFTIGLPMLAGLVYYAGFAADRYVSTSVVTVRRAGVEAPSATGLAALLGGAIGPSYDDARLLREFVHSLALMRTLEQRLQLRAHFERPLSDPLFRLWPGTSQEWMLEYWRSRVDVALDEASGLLTLRVQGFDAPFAQRLNQAILAECEAFVNAISQRIASEQLAFAGNELERAGEQLRQARSAMVAFQSTHRVLDPAREAEAVGALNAELHGQLARTEAELNAKRGYLNDDAPDIVALAARADALRAQVKRETAGATGGAGARALTHMAVRFEDLKTRAGFAEQVYRAALATMEATRLETARKVKSLVIVEPPGLAERAEYPRRLYNLATLAVACLLAYAIAGMTLALVREHRE